MDNYEKLIVPLGTSIIDAMSIIDNGAKGIAFICGNDNVVLATLTDGDIRRHILKNGELNTMIDNIGNRNFLSAKVGYDSVELRKLAVPRMIKNIPVLGDRGELIDVFDCDKFGSIKKTQIGTPVVIMAGGKGTRLYPYTKVLPKPLIPIGDISITEHIIKSFNEYSCTDFSMIVNHKKNMIKAYFADIQDDGYTINFFDEDNPLGTGGGLSLIKGQLNETFFMTNCDVLVFEDYSKILDYHRAEGNMLTIVCSTKRFTVPYGTVGINDLGMLVSITEKPSVTSLVNTGLYIIESEFLTDIADNRFAHITDLIIERSRSNVKIGVYPISESKWADMGQHDEMERMKELLQSKNQL